MTMRSLTPVQLDLVLVSSRSQLWTGSRTESHFLFWPQCLLLTARGRRSGARAHTTGCVFTSGLALTFSVSKRGWSNSGGRTGGSRDCGVCRSFGVTAVRFPVQRKTPPTPQVAGRKWAGPGTGSVDSQPHCSSTTNEEEEERQRTEGGPEPGGSDRGPEGSKVKRRRLDGTDEALTNRRRVPGSCGLSGDEGESESGRHGNGSDQQEAEEEGGEDSRAAELQTVGSLKVTIQRSSESREFRSTERPSAGLHCHVCRITCRSLQVFRDHMSGADHLRRLEQITRSVSLDTQTQDRGRRPDPQRWCDACQTHFSGDVILHRRTKQHKVCKQVSRPFCPVCKRHFRTPRKFVEHMKSPEHKQQVLLEEAQEEELITVDAVGCFEGEEDKVEEVEVDEDEENGEDEEAAEPERSKIADAEETQTEDYDPNTTYGAGFVVPVSGFMCRLCNKFYHRETTARHTHCRTHTHYTNLQIHRLRRKHCGGGGAGGGGGGGGGGADQNTPALS
ncbi:cdkn1a interacting zinc finger protein 1b [Sphaeramia orbicularis]|uniref:cdkn1a interacting zinc finger protein 1b n=1 Tax=Sphaeramia orbicularis TaxID=375764 RepID=UPI00117C57B9|nr:cip1-interacting zinc finger protein-like [Sphaeramia orbicularis]